MNTRHHRSFQFSKACVGSSAWTAGLGAFLIASFGSVAGCTAPNESSSPVPTADGSIATSRQTHSEPGKPATAARNHDGVATQPRPAAAADVLTTSATSLGLAAFSANGRIQPHGRPTEYYFEYGPTVAYGSKTVPSALAPRLAAFYRESWEGGLSGWRGGSGSDLVHVASELGNFVRYAEPTGNDYNHVDGIGILHLVQYFYPGFFDLDHPSAAFGGADPDMRDARVRVSVRGNNWEPSTTELLFWAQSDLDHGNPTLDVRFTNWANTGNKLTDALLSGRWENVEYRLYNDTNEWTYAGTNRELNEALDRSVYHYAPLNDVLSHLDVDFFHLLAYADPYLPPSGSIDFDNLEIAYRNHSLVFPSNGATLASAPGSTEDAAALTDGWRNGPGKMWESPTAPQGPQEIVYDFENPVTIEKVQLHQHTEWPSRDIEVLTSADGNEWTQLVEGTFEQASGTGANFSFLLAKELHSAPTRKLMVRILSGYRPEHWGLGEIEVFGAGAVMRTDDDWYRVNTDISGLTAGETYHYRLVALVDGKVVNGDDMTFTVAPTAKPEIVMRPATRIRASWAKVEARLNTLGEEVQIYFEYGPSKSYGFKTEARRAGPEITPRTVLERIDGLTPGSVVHYRLVAEGGHGTTYGEDMTFTAR